MYNCLRSIWRALADHGIIVAAAFFATFVASLIASDFLPPGIESTVVAIICYLLAIGALGIVAALAIKLAHTAVQNRRKFGLRSLFVTISILAVLLTLTKALGSRTVVCYLFVFFQLITPVLFVKYGAHTGSAGGGAVRGALVGFVSVFVLIILYGLIMGIQGSYLVGPFGPGFNGLENLQFMMCFWLIGIWPLLVVLVAGAIGGIIGRKLRRPFPPLP